MNENDRTDVHRHTCPVATVTERAEPELRVGTFFLSRPEMNRKLLWQSTFFGRQL